VSLDDVTNLQNTANEAQRKRKNVDSWWPEIADHSLHDDGDDGDLALDCGSVFSDDADSVNESMTEVEIVQSLRVSGYVTRSS
jgi:hypothetical protein